MFTHLKTDGGRVLPFEYLPCSAIRPRAGLAMVLSSGQLAVCGATVKPEFICQVECASAVTTGTLVPVVRVHGDTEWETKNTAALTAVPVGGLVTLDAAGLLVTATTTSGVAEIVAKDADAAGSRVVVRFPD